MERRHFLQRVSGALVAGWTARGALAAPATPKSAALVAVRRDWQALLPMGATVPAPTDIVAKSPAEWKRELTPERYYVLREEGTERPFTSPLDKEKRAGVFTCAGCALPLFTSAMKFDSGTGWPSFFTSIPGHTATKRDTKLFLPRTEYHCVRCGGHQGHVFDDGPAPTMERWCNNGVALRFVPTAAA